MNGAFAVKANALTFYLYFKLYSEFIPGLSIFLGDFRDTAKKHP